MAPDVGRGGVIPLNRDGAGAAEAEVGFAALFGMAVFMVEIKSLFVCVFVGFCGRELASTLTPSLTLMD